MFDSFFFFFFRFNEITIYPYLSLFLDANTTIEIQNLWDCRPFSGLVINWNNRTEADTLRYIIVRYCLKLIYVAVARDQMHIDVLSGYDIEESVDLFNVNKLMNTFI